MHNYVSVRLGSGHASPGKQLREIWFAGTYPFGMRQTRDDEICVWHFTLFIAKRFGNSMCTTMFESRGSLAEGLLDGDNVHM